MMIAFITIKSSLVPLIEGLCALLDTIRIDNKFEKNFNVATYFTVRALRIKGVSDDIIAKARSTLNNKQSQQTTDRQHARVTQAENLADLWSSTINLIQVRLYSFRRSLALPAFLSGPDA